MMKTASKSKGFTLAELLIALAILGVIATFTIPKILDSSTNGKLTSIAKETASMISGAYSSYKQNSTPAFNMMATQTNMADFMNYVRVAQATTAGAFQTPASGTNFSNGCTANLASATPCLVLHNGAYLQFDSAATFGTDPAPNNPASTSFINFNVDPDGTGAQAGAVTFILYYNGRITTYAAAGSPALVGGATTPTAADPSWIANWN
jgi:prepilin-type N-terminal cleavage/methylation domain-containing protein